MRIHTRFLLFALGFVLVSPLSGQNVRQSVHDLSAFITLDFSSFFRVKVPAHMRVRYENGLLELLHSRIGVYQSEYIDTTLVEEWKGFHRFQLSIDNSASVTIQAIRDDGTLSVVPSCGHGFISESDIFLGPYDNGFLFLYTMYSNTIYSVFSPNGVQLPIRFNKVSDLPKCDNLPPSHTGLIEFLQSEGKKAEHMFRGTPSSIGGWYKCLTIPSEFNVKGIDEYYLKIDNSYNYFQLTVRGGLFWYDDNLFDAPRMNPLSGPYGRYVVNGDYLKFIRIPPVPDLMCRIKRRALSMNGGHKTDVEILRKKEYEMDRIVSREICRYWMDGSTNTKMTVFKKIPRTHMSIETLKICRDGKDVTTEDGVRMLFKEIMK